MLPFSIRRLSIRNLFRRLDTCYLLLSSNGGWQCIGSLAGLVVCPALATNLVNITDRLLSLPLRPLLVTFSHVVDECVSAITLLGLCFDCDCESLGNIGIGIRHQHRCLAFALASICRRLLRLHARRPSVLRPAASTDYRLSLKVLLLSSISASVSASVFVSRFRAHCLLSPHFHEADPYASQGKPPAVSHRGNIAWKTVARPFRNEEEEEAEAEEAEEEEPAWYLESDPPPPLTPPPRDPSRKSSRWEKAAETPDGLWCASACILHLVCLVLLQSEQKQSPTHPTAPLEAGTGAGPWFIDDIDDAATACAHPATNWARQCVSSPVDASQCHRPAPVNISPPSRASRTLSFEAFQPDPVMGHDTAMAQSNGYSSDTWTSMSPYSNSPYSNSPLTEYNNTFSGFVPHGLPSESMSRMPPPPPQAHTHQMIHPSPMAHQQLPMLNTTWPSQLTNPTPSGSYSAPPLSMTPVSSAPPVDPPRLPAPHEKSRKTLTTEQKRAMCQFHEDNPGTRQADIGARFGVERSTVSKVLRHREQYLKRDQEPEHPSVKRGKGKHPDFDRTLSNYVRRQQQRGFQVSDDEILEQARLFAHASGNQESLTNGLTSLWLQKFKQKHGIGAGKLMRRASETNIPDAAKMSTLLRSKDDQADRRLSNFIASGISSAASPTGQLSPLSGSRSDEDGHADGIDFEFSYKHPESQSTTSLTSELRETGNSSFSGSAMSPTAPFTFSPDPNVGGFPMDHSLQLRPNAVEFQHREHREKRSNTFPSLNVDYVNQNSSTEPMTPRHQPSSTAPSSALDSPAHEFQGNPFSIDTGITSPPALHRSSSNSSMTARSTTTPATNSALSSTPVDSSPVSPSQEDARRAATTLLNYIQSTGNFEQNEYLTVVQLTKKLQIHQHQTARPSIGGLSRIPEGDVEGVQPKMESA
ncbi:hypothetical protein G7046_g8307 [Stylonectria norvegica]|nr:hypothetical protein G7046_g8307 [Stylonectria norvegica]